MKLVTVVSLAAAAFALLVLLSPNASATTNQIGCATTGYAQTGGATAWWYATTDTTTDASSCVPESSSVTHANAGASEGACTSVTIRAGTTGTPTGGTPTDIRLYLYADNDAHTHTNTFTGFLADIDLGTTLPATVNACRTMTGLSAGTSAPGNYRMVLRVCDYIAGSGCSGGTRAYDLWSDGGGNLPTGGSAYSNERSGILVARALMLCERDSANAILASDTSTYVPGDVPNIAVCTHAFNTNTYNMIANLWDTTGSTTNDFVNTGTGPGGSGNPLTYTFPRVIGAEPDGNGDKYANGATYVVNLTWSDGGLLGCYACIPQGIVGWQNVTTGGSLIGTSHDATFPWGGVAKTLTATCILRDPLTNSATLSPARLARAEQAQCRGAGAGGLAQIKNARGEDWPSGAFLSVFARRETMPVLDTTDANRCDVTTSTAGIFVCDSTLHASTYANNAVVGGATATTSLGYGVDVAIYQDSARATLLARAHIANLFDVTPSHFYASAAGTCNTAPTAALPIAQRGQPETLSFRLCNSRGELISATGTTDVTRQDTYIVDQGPQSVTPASGSYSWIFTVNGASQHTASGYAKRLNFTDGQGNNATADSTYNLTDLLNVQAFHTWLKSCSGSESSLFVAAADTICANEGPVTSATGASWTASKTFMRWYNDTPDNAQMPSDNEAGVTAQTSSNHEITPQPPAGTWTFTVRAYDANGNYGEAVKTITIVSPLTSIYDILCSGTNVRIEPGGTMTAICTTMKRDSTTYVLQAYCPDTPPYYRVNYTTSDGAWQTAVPTSTPASDVATPCSYWVNWAVPNDWPDGQPAELLINANMTGAPIHAYYPLNIETTKGADPIFAVAEYSWDTHAATIAASLKFGNGAARSGVASLITGQLYAPDDTTATTQLNFTERAATGTYYAHVPLGTSPTRGTWLAVITAPQPTGNATTSAATTFPISENFSLDFLDARSLTFAFWNATNTTSMYTWNLTNQTSAITWSLLNASWAATNASNAYAWALENQTQAKIAFVQLTANTTSDSIARLAVNVTFARAEANASAAYGWALQNQTIAAQQAAIAYATSLEAQALAQLAALQADFDAQVAQTNALVNATANTTYSKLASASAALAITIAGDNGGNVSYAGRATRISTSITDAGPGIFAPWFWTWDLGDNTSAIGPTVYHAWEKPGNYTIIARATDALGNMTLMTTSVRVNLSTPAVQIVGPANVTAGARATWTIGTTVDPHDDIAATDWEADPTDIDGWLTGHQHLNKGWCTNCATYTTLFLAVGDHTLELTARNAHGVMNTTTLTVHVQPYVAPQTSSNAPLGIGANDLAHANDKARGFMDQVQSFLHWLTG